MIVLVRAYQVKPHCIEHGVVYLGAGSLLPPGCPSPAGGQEGEEWVWLIAARAEASSVLQPWQTQHSTDGSCGISSREGRDSTDAFVQRATKTSSRNLMPNQVRLIQTRASVEEGCDCEAESLCVRWGWKNLICLTLQNQG